MQAPTEYPIHELLSRRWSPYAFSSRPVADADLRSLLEAARWAPSSYNEQPWSFLLARQSEPAEFARALSCLTETNQAWAKAAPVLLLTVTRLNFTHNGKPNRAAVHDLGLAAANLALEATARGLAVHQMIGVKPERVRELYGVPADHEPMTGIAIGYAGTPETLPEALRDRDRQRRPRRPLSGFVFGGHWGSVAPIVSSPE